MGFESTQAVYKWEAGKYSHVEYVIGCMGKIITTVRLV